jgi:hypothetical protein
MQVLVHSKIQGASKARCHRKRPKDDSPTGDGVSEVSFHTQERGREGPDSTCGIRASKRKYFFIVTGVFSLHHDSVLLQTRGPTATPFPACPRSTVSGMRATIARTEPQAHHCIAKIYSQREGRGQGRVATIRGQNPRSPHFSSRDRDPRSPPR